MKRLIVAASAAVFLSGCVTTNATMLGEPVATVVPVDPRGVAFYRTADQVPRRYREVALLHSAGDTAYTDEAAMFDSMRKKAAKLGANAIILDAMSEPTAATKVAAAFLGAPSTRKGKAIAVYVEPAA